MGAIMVNGDGWVDHNNFKTIVVTYVCISMQLWLDLTTNAFAQSVVRVAVYKSKRKQRPITVLVLAILSFMKTHNEA